MKFEKLRTGIIGVGTVALKAHIPALRELGIEIVGFADPSESSLQRVRAKKRFNDYQQLLKEKMDFVSICTPPSTHYGICMDAIEAGVNILVEKPLTLSVAQAKQLKETAEKKDVKICVVHNYKYLEPFVEMKRIQDNGELGLLLSIRAIFHEYAPPTTKKWLMNGREAGVSGLFESIHPIYLMLWFGGKPRSVFAIGKKILPNLEIIGDIRALIDFEECTGYLELSQFSSAPQYLFQITGTGASAQANPSLMRVMAPSTPLDVLQEAFSYFPSFYKLFRNFLSSRLQPHLSYAWGTHYKLIMDYAEAILLDKDPPVSVEEGIQSIRLASAIEQSLKHNMKVTI